MKTLADRSPHLKDVLDNVDFIQFTTSRENAEILRQLVELFSIQKLHHVSPDILGDAYEWILRYFVPMKAKEGEVYTPREVIKLLIEILDPKPGESVYDPASASNGMLIISYKHVEDKYGKSEEVIKKGEFWKPRFRYGFVPKQSADWAWVQHMLASAKEDTGRVGVVIDNGCLFRGGKEQAIRSRMLEDDLIESLMLLPEKLFYNTGAPGALVFLNKNKPEARKGKDLFAR